MKLRFLGTGTSFGIPVIGCRCRVCRSEDPRNRRTRHGMVIESDGRRLLVDTPPELRLQLVAADIDRVDALFLTHPHADHLHGLDDLRAFTSHSGERIPLHLAAELGRDDIAVLLLDNGADVNAKDEIERTTLHVAARLGRQELAGRLIAGGAEVNAKDSEGRTALHFATRARHDALAELLREHGATE